ncbi:MAG: tetratricopeptide repeat protein, partial [Caldimonas sp.]
DTFRITSLSLANLQGAASIAASIDSPARKSYEFRVYEQLGDLYIKQDRTKDAADTFGLYARRNPLDAQAPQLQARVIEIYERGGFANLALDAKKEYVVHYGSASEFRRANPAGWERARPLVKTHLAELARHYHASAQQTRLKADYDEAVHWYRTLLASFPSDLQAAPSNFLLAELLFEDRRYAEASIEYEKTAYGYPAHAKSTDAGYAALLSYAQQQKAAPAAEVPALQRASVASALRFAAAFPDDARAGPVLADSAEKLYALRDGDQAARVAQQVLDLKAPAADAQRKVAWTVLAHTAFERGAFERAEAGYAEVLKLTPATDPARNDLVEREAASIYKQGEQARAAGKPLDAVAHFARVGTVAPQSPVRATAQYDAAATLIALKDWDGAVRTLEDFRRRYPDHPLQAEVGAKLAVAYVEQGQWAGAAGELERIAAANADPKIARDALWQAAEYYQKAGARPAATKAWERYVAQYPQPLGPAVEARFRLAHLAHEGGDTTRELAAMKDILNADQAGGTARTDRTRYLGASAALALAEPVAESYRKVALVEPLQRQLKLKKTKMEETLKAYAVAADYGVADVTTAATYRIAVVYRDFGKALMSSERPHKLSKAEREQYDVLLEEQAWPFEEKATELHEVNAHRAAVGIYDQWVQASFDALRELRPVRYGKNERSEGVIDAIR